MTLTLQNFRSIAQHRDGFLFAASSGQSLSRVCRIASVILLIVVSSAFSTARAADVSQFRGPNGDGIFERAAPPLNFSETQNLKWKQPIPGKGWSSPVIADGKVWLTTAIEALPSEEERTDLLTKAGDDPKTFAQRAVAKSLTLQLLRIDADSGEIERTLDLVNVEEPAPIHKTNSYASPTPFIEGDHIFCHFGTFGTFCIRRDDCSVVWKRTIPVQHSVGPGSSPFIANDLLILICDGTENQFVVALNKQTGEEAWKTDRPPINAPDGEQKKSFDTPILVTDHNGREQLICMGSQWLVSYDPETGSEIWKLYHGKGFSVVPRPVVGHGMVYISTGFAKAELWAVRIDGTGDVTDSHVAWKANRNVPTKPSPLLVGDRVYLISDTGIATCFDAIDGTIIWTERIGGNYSASPVLMDDHILLANHDGKVTVFKPADRFEKTDENVISGQIMASPVAMQQSLFLRTDTALYRFDNAEN